MNRLQASLITVVLLAVLSFVLPMILGDFTLGFDLPPFGYFTIFDPNSMFGAYGFIIGGVIAIVIMYVMMNKRRKRD